MRGCGLRRVKVWEMEDFGDLGIYGSGDLKIWGSEEYKKPSSPIPKIPNSKLSLLSRYCLSPQDNFARSKHSQNLGNGQLQGYTSNRIAPPILQQPRCGTKSSTQPCTRPPDVEAASISEIVSEICVMAMTLTRRKDAQCESSKAQSHPQPGG